MRKGLTLLEVLIALSVLSVGVLGIYSVLDESVRLSNFSTNRLEISDIAYERVLRDIHYPKVALPDNLELDGKKYTYEYKFGKTLLPTVESVNVKVISREGSYDFEFFKRN